MPYAPILALGLKGLKSLVKSPFVFPTIVSGPCLWDVGVAVPPQADNMITSTMRHERRSIPRLVFLIDRG
jgi:hypothetical protein